MLTLFTIPKPFSGSAAVAQMNALRSWRELGDDTEIIVLGDEVGTAEAAARLDARHVPDLARNEWGTPLVSDAFARVRELAANERLVYANADIVLLADLRVAVRRLGARRALLVGRRSDLAVDGELSFDRGWQERLRGEVARHGREGTERQIDYIVLPRDVDWEMPPFAVGRPGWDNWLLFRARSLGLGLVDVSPVVLAVHQTHGYEHVPQRRGASWQGPEAERNRTLAAEMGLAYGLYDATHVLTRRLTLPALGLRHLKRRARRQPLLAQGVRLADELRRC